jgi:phosphoglycerate dehydrogenase-like enzyme
VAHVTPPRVAILDDYQDVALGLADWQSLPPGSEVRSFSTPARDEAELVRRLLSFDVVVAMRERTAFPASVIEALPRLKLLASTGLRNAAIDLQACRRQGVIACGSSGPRDSLASTAEMAWALVLALHKQLIASDQALRRGAWQPLLARPLHGRVLGLAGLGNVGQRMARIAAAFGMEVIVWSPHLTAERASAAGARAVGCEALFREADVLSLHLVLGEGTAGLVSAARLAAMKPGAFLVNTARAGLVDEQALLAALRERRIGGAGLDVFWQEPLAPEHELNRLDNVVLTPHLGYATAENLAGFYAGVLENIHAWLAGRPPQLLAG